MAGVVVAVSFKGSLPPTPARLGAVRPRESAWQGITEEAEFLVLLGFSSEKAAQEDLRSLVEAESPEGPDVALPISVSHILVEHAHGVVLDEVPRGGYLAVARTVANPGYGHEAGERMEETVSTFVQLPAYCGHLQGYNEAIEEEAWAFVFASSRANVPIPQNHEVAVRVYRRIS
ncbi:hypothetical protein EON82_06410 [bacterium]|nr:MAG: hypothetical protein EON82_06410 [bacterium]